jgi:hypothetical protein
MNDDTDQAGGKQDPLARIFLIVVAILLIIGIALGVRALLVQRSTAPASTAATTARPATASESFPGLGQRMRAGIDELSRLLSDMQSPTAPRPPEPPVQVPPQRSADPGSAAAPAKPPATQANDPQRSFPAAAAPTGPQVIAVPADGNWSYDIFFGPGWQKNGQLRYSTHLKAEQSTKGVAQSKVGSNMSWTPNGGQTTSWYFGIVEADHPSHANTRFPGFFMHAAYLPQSLQAGNRILWEFPWQGGGTGQVRRFDMRVVGWETVKVPAGEFTAVHLDGKLQYVDKDAAKSEVRYAIWYAPRAKQVVRVLWLGRSPDESSAEMIAELASFNAP